MIPDFRLPVGHVQRNQVASLPVRCGIDLGGNDDVDDPMLPGHGHVAMVRLVHHFVEQIVESTQFAHDFARHVLLQRQKLAAAVHGVGLLLRSCADAVDVVARLHGAQIPHVILVERTEQVHLHHHPRSPRSRTKSRRRSK
jgi:hypothetical protein